MKVEWIFIIIPSIVALVAIPPWRCWIFGHKYRNEGIVFKCNRCGKMVAPTIYF